MALTHNYLETAGRKPTAAEASKAELVINLADGTLWSENGAGTVIPLAAGGGESWVLKWTGLIYGSVDVQAWVSGETKFRVEFVIDIDDSDSNPGVLFCYKNLAKNSSDSYYTVDDGGQPATYARMNLGATRHAVVADERSAYDSINNFIEVRYHTLDNITVDSTARVDAIYVWE